MPFKNEIFMNETGLNNDSKHKKNTPTKDNKPQIGKTTNKNMLVQHNAESKGENLLKGPGGRTGMMLGIFRSQGLDAQTCRGGHI